MSLTMDYSDMEGLKELSEKGYKFNVRRVGDKLEVNHESLGEINSRQVGIIQSHSGYLAICDESMIDVVLAKTDVSWESRPLFKRGDKFIFNFNLEPWISPSTIMQGDNLVTFRTGGDGNFPVLSSKEGFYIETWEIEGDPPNIYDKKLFGKFREGNVEVEYQDRRYGLEGVVGVDSGRIGITDPEVHTVSKFAEDNNIITIIKIEPGIYSCKYIESGRNKGFYFLSRKS
jgi:hypothetical protein